VSIAVAGKKIKLDKEAIIEILVANTDSESGAEASDFEDYFEEEEEEQQQVSAEVKPQAVTSGGLPTWGPPQGTQIFILLLVQQKV
jgi:hypothetical protein